MSPSESLPILRFQDPDTTGAPAPQGDPGGSAGNLTESSTGTPDGQGGTSEETPPSPFGSFLPILLIGGLFWLMILRPQMKEQKRRKEMLSDLAKGDEVMTTGGLFGTIVKIDEARVTLEVAQGVQLVYSRAAVQGRVADILAEAEKGSKGAKK